MKISDRLRNLGITLPASAGPLGAYKPAVQSGNLVFVSGQLPIQDNKLAYTGKVGVKLSVEDAKKAAALCFINALGALSAIPIPVDNIVQVVRLTGYVNVDETFEDHAQILNGASELSLQIFGDSGVHARSAVGVSSLPKGASVELEVIFQIMA